MSLGSNIARNAALRENVFMMAICIELRIPLFLVGKPGSSKSLAKSIVQTSMQATASNKELLRGFKQVSEMDGSQHALWKWSKNYMLVVRTHSSLSFLSSLLLPFLLPFLQFFPSLPSPLLFSPTFPPHPLLPISHSLSLFTFSPLFHRFISSPTSAASSQHQRV